MLTADYYFKKLLKSKTPIEANLTMLQLFGFVLNRASYSMEKLVWHK